MPGDELKSLLDAEEAIFAAIARRDCAALDRLIDDSFVLHMHGQPTVDKPAFLEGIAAIPGEIFSVTGMDLRAHRTATGGLVSGTQVVHLRIDDKEIIDRGAFVDLFVWRDDRWVATYAFNVGLPELPESKDRDDGTTARTIT